MSKITENEVSHIISIMQDASRVFRGTGNCFERSEYIRHIFGSGEVMTFSIEGLSIKHTKNIENVVQCTPRIRIPYSPNVYREEVIWAYHTVFVYKGYVFTYEIDNWHCSLKMYRGALNSLNAQIIKARNEKQIK